MSYDYLIVGAGFTGSVCARQLAEAGKKILLIDKRNHIGGNAYDYTNEHGVRIHKYGPHIFHTNSEKVFGYLSRFTEWRAYEHRVMANLDGKRVPFPINLNTLEMVYGRSFTSQSAMDFLSARAAYDYHGGPVETAEDQIVSQVGRELFEIFFAGYTKKMWGVEAKELDKSVTARIPVRFDRDDRYFTDRFQAMPQDGYAALFERLLDHDNIDMRLETECFDVSKTDRWSERVIWTGPIDAYFKHMFGSLPYRSLHFVAQDAPAGPGVYLGTTVNYPDARKGQTRSTDMGMLTGTGGAYTSLVSEFPQAEGEPYYPIPAPANAALYKQYEKLADNEPHVTFAGRLGRYQYLNMDQAVGQALMISERLLSIDCELTP